MFAPLQTMPNYKQRTIVLTLYSSMDTYRLRLREFVHAFVPGAFGSLQISGLARHTLGTHNAFLVVELQHLRGEPPDKAKLHPSCLRELLDRLVIARRSSRSPLLAYNVDRESLSDSGTTLWRTQSCYLQASLHVAAVQG